MFFVRNVGTQDPTDVCFVCNRAGVALREIGMKRTPACDDDNDASYLYLCAPCGTELMTLLYKELICGNDPTLLLSVLPINRAHAEHSERTRAMSFEVFKMEEQGGALSDAVRLAMHKVREAAVHYLANAGRAATWL